MVENAGTAADKNINIGIEVASIKVVHDLYHFYGKQEMVNDIDKAKKTRIDYKAKNPLV